MIVLLVIMFLAAISLTVYGLFVPYKRSRKARKRRKPVTTAADPDLSFEQEKISQLELRIGSLEAELEKAKGDYSKIHGEVKAARKSESELKRELERRQAWVGKSEEEVSKVKSEKIGLKNRFVEKEKQLQVEFTKNVNLNKEFKEALVRIKSLEVERKGLTEQLELSKHKIERFTEEMKAQVDNVKQLKRRQDESEWVPKKEFNKLNQEYTELEKELEAAEERIKKLESRFKSGAAAVQQAPTEPQQPQESPVEAPIEAPKEVEAPAQEAPPEEPAPE
ncbi:hypothetical protein ACFL1K_05655, partial [Candidatus Omnitrophota bacterium]